MYFMKSAWNASDFRAGESRLPLSSLSLSRFSSVPPREHDPSLGYSVAERGYKNRINRVYDADAGKGNAGEAFRGKRFAETTAIASEQTYLLDK